MLYLRWKDIAHFRFQDAKFGADAITLSAISGEGILLSRATLYSQRSRFSFCSLPAPSEAYIHRRWFAQKNKTKPCGSDVHLDVRIRESESQST